MPRTKKEAVAEPIETQLWKAADKLRKNIDAAEYKHVVLGLVFLKYISDAFEELYEKLQQDEYSDPEDVDEYKAEERLLCPAGIPVASSAITGPKSRDRTPPRPSHGRHRAPITQFERGPSQGVRQGEPRRGERGWTH